MATDVAAGHSSDISPGTLQEASLFAQTANEPMLPSVTYVSLTLTDDGSANATAVLLHDTIRTLRLLWQLGCTGKSVSLILARIRHCCPHLPNLAIDIDTGIEISDALILEVVETVQSLSQLESLEIPPSFITNTRLWDVLGTLPRLKTLRASEDRTVTLTTPNVIQSSLTFNNNFLSLCMLDLSTTFPTAISLFTGSPPRDTVSSVVLRISGPQGISSTVGDLLPAITKAVPGLKTLCVALDFDDMRITLTDITPLMSVKSIRVLRASTDYVALLTDDDYAILATSLPQLEELEITPLPKDSTTPPATLLALSHIARHCRQIEQISICLNTADESLPGTSTPLSVFTHTLQRINFGLSIVHGHQVIYPLARMFTESVPEMWGGHSWHFDFRYWNRAESWARIDAAATDWGAVWTAVEDILPFVDAVRRDALHPPAGPSV